MKITIRKALIASAFLLSASFSSSAQDKPPFYDDIQTIKAYDQIYAPPKNPILFIGSSSIRLWVDFSKTFKDYTVLNRGIGGAITNDVDRYLEDLVFRYQPRQIVIYVGENDLLKAPDATSVFDDFKKLYADIRTKLPLTPIIYLAIKGSPSRNRYRELAIKSNQLISNYILTQKNIKFIDIYHPMLDSKSEMQPSLFKDDMLHMNAKGYQIWNRLLIPQLLKN